METNLHYEKIDALDIYWYATNNQKYTDDSKILEKQLLKKHLKIYDRLPAWNND